MKIRRFMSMYMFLVLVFSNAIAMMPDNPDNNKRKRDDNCLEETFDPKDYDDYFKWCESEENKESSNISSSSEQQSKNVHAVDMHKKRKIIEKAPENSSEDNQKFNSNNTQNNHQENGPTVPTQAAFNKLITNDPIPKSIKDCDLNWYESESMQEEEEIIEKASVDSSQDNQNFNINNTQNNFQENGPRVPTQEEFNKQINNYVIPQPIKGNNVVNNMVINGPVSFSIQQPLSLEQMMVISQLLQQQQQQSQQIVSQQNIDIPSNAQDSSNVLISDQEDKEIKNIKDPYITTRPDGLAYCLVCKKRVLKPGVHKPCMEHRINASAGKNILKKELQTPLECKFPDCNKVFNDIDDFVDHMYVEHVDTNGRCTHPKCFEKKGVQRVKRAHFSSCHINSRSKKFFRCPFCKNYESKTVGSLLEQHLLSDKKCFDCLEQIIKKSKK